VISSKLVRLIECHSGELSTELVAKLERSSRTSDPHKVPVEELRGPNPRNLAGLERVAAHQDGTRHRAALF
jgi:hypothetical protein